MYVLDTNVVSEMRKVRTDKIDANVARWFDSVEAGDLYISAITLMELEIGLLLVERRDASRGATLRAWLHTKVLSAFFGRVLPFDADVAWACAKLNVPDRRSLNDSVIAATAKCHGMAVATRNVVDFEPTGVRILNPWLP